MPRPKFIVPLSVVLLFGLVVIAAYIVYRQEGMSETETDPPAANSEPARQAPVSPKIKARAGDTPLHLAVRRGDRDLIARLLDEGADVHARNKDGVTPLHVAIWKHDRRVVRMLLDRGADANAKRVGGAAPPLHSAIWTGDRDIVEMLLDGGADLKQDQPVVTAARERHWDVCRLLVERGADVSEGDPYSSGRKALHYAAISGRADIGELLIDHGAKVNAPAYRGGAPLHLAARWGRNRMVKMLIAHGAEVDVMEGADRSGSATRTPLYQAARSGCIDTVDLLLAHGADVNAADDGGYTLLDYAVGGGGPRTAELLISRGAEINPTTPRVWTPLQVLAWGRGRSGASVEKLVARGAKVDLFSACGLNRPEDVRKLLKADPAGIHARIRVRCIPEDDSWMLMAGPSEDGARDGDDLTPLHYARRHHHVEIARLLLDAGAAVDVESAAWLGMVEKVKTIIERDGLAMDSRPVARAMAEAAAAGHKPVVVLLLSRGFDPGKNDDAEPLVNAAENRHPEIVKLLLKNGAHVDRSGFWIYAALHAAARNGDIEMAKLLLAHGANVDVPEEHEDQETPLGYAIRAEQKEMVRFLAKAGAKPCDEFEWHELVLVSGVSEDMFRWAFGPFVDHWKAKGGPEGRLEEVLLVAAKMDLVDEVRTLIDLGADINARPCRDILSRAGTRTRELLLARGIEVDFRSTCALGMTDRVRTMLAADPSLAEGRYRRPINYAARRGHLEIVKLLLAHGAKPRQNVLSSAVYGGNKDVVRLLLDRSAERGDGLAATCGGLMKEDMVQFIQAYRAAHPDRW